jgi:excisionase family DNA binding protein
MKASEAASRLGVTPATLARWSDAGAVEAVRIGVGRRRHYRVSDIRRLLDDRAAQ